MPSQGGQHVFATDTGVCVSVGLCGWFLGVSSVSDAAATCGVLAASVSTLVSLVSVSLSLTLCKYPFSLLHSVFVCVSVCLSVYDAGLTLTLSLSISLSPLSLSLYVFVLSLSLALSRSLDLSVLSLSLPASLAPSLSLSLPLSPSHSSILCHSTSPASRFSIATPLPTHTHREYVMCVVSRPFVTSLSVCVVSVAHLVDLSPPHWKTRLDWMVESWLNIIYAFKHGQGKTGC